MPSIFLALKVRLIYRLEGFISWITRAENLYPASLKKIDLNQPGKRFRNQIFYSESLQDLFAQNVARASGLTGYLELGSGEPIENNNTYLLETSLDFAGLSVELDFELCEKWKSVRRNPVICADATFLNYESELLRLGLTGNLAYLQIDIDPAQRSLDALYKIPFGDVNFACITFEHDIYRQTRRLRTKQRKFLKNLGYILVCKDVKVTRLKKFEDWWVNPKLVDIKSPLIPRGRAKTADRLKWHFN